MATEPDEPDPDNGDDDLVEIGDIETVQDARAEAADSGIIPIDRERRYRELEAKCARLESVIAQQTSIRPADYAEEQHGFRCGQHPRVVVSGETPRVWCAVCGEELDPCEVLREYARKERNFVFNLMHDRTEAKHLKAEIEDLKRVRLNLRAQVKRAKIRSNP